MRNYTREKKQFGYCLFRLVPCMVILWLSLSLSLSSWPLQTPSSISFPFSRWYYPFYYPSNTTSTNNNGLSSSQHLLPFLVLNAIVILVFYLSNNTTGSSNNDDEERNDAVSTKPSDIYDQHVSYSSSRGTAAEAAVNVTFQIVRVEKNINIPSHRPTAMTEKLSKEDRRINNRGSSYERSKSDVADTVKKRKSPPLRRTETEKGPVVVVSSRSSNDDKKSLEEMTSEEFRMTVDRFIASNKKIQMDEMAYGYR